MSSHVRYGAIRRCSASPRSPCDGTPSASIWPSPRQTPGPSCPYPSDRTTPDAIIKLVSPSVQRNLLPACYYHYHYCQNINYRHTIIIAGDIPGGESSFRSKMKKKMTNAIGKLSVGGGNDGRRGENPTNVWSHKI